MNEPLYRSRRDRVIGGIAGGLARNLGIDSTWVRLAFVILAFMTQGVAILIYLVLLFVIPEAPEGVEEGRGAVGAGERGAAGATGGSGATDAATGATGPTTAGARAGAPTERTPLERWFGPNAGGDSSRTAALVVGVVLVAVGAWLLLRRYVLIDFDLGWPLVAIILGAILVVAALRTGGRRS